MGGTVEQPSFDARTLPRDAFPFEIEARLATTGERVWNEIVCVPGELQVPPLAREHGVSVVVTINWPDGRSESFWPPCACGHEWSEHFARKRALGFCGERGCQCQTYRPFKPGEGAFR